MAVRKIRANYRSVTGLVADDQSARSTGYESSLERDFIKHLLFNKNVLGHEEQPLTINFTDTSGKPRSYTPDLLISYRKDVVMTKDWQPLLAEVKYSAVKAIASGKERIDLRLLEQIEFTSPSDRKWRADMKAAI